jgi:TetR/AcrR family transcriptional regulator, mexCD-oprJ operon repressor
MAGVTDHRRAVAERNAEAILSAAEALLARGEKAHTTAVAAEAGVSRVTVYTHFPTPGDLLEAIVKRAVDRVTYMLDALQLERGTAGAALDRLVSEAWSELDRNRAIAEAAGESLNAKAMSRSHAALHRPIAALIERGRREGEFRSDLPAQWLISSYFALMHACADDVRAGRVDAEDASRILQRSIRAVWVGAEHR